VAFRSFGASEWSPTSADEQERTFLRSAKEAELSVEGVFPSMLHPCPFHSADPADYRVSRQMATLWHPSMIWSWDKASPYGLGPLRVLLPIGLYGKIATYLQQLQSTAKTRCLHDNFLAVRMDYA
jgi:hypothetical protein